MNEFSQYLSTEVTVLFFQPLFITLCPQCHQFWLPDVASMLETDETSGRPWI